MEPYVPQKVQEAIFNQILDRPENKVCADCPNKSPTWASIDFGVLVCLRCSGAHRHLSPVVTRVRSAKIDDWKMEHIEILAAVGNKIGNDYWECNLPSSFKKPDISTSLEDVLEMVKNKYIKAMYIPKDRINPVKEFLEAKTDGQTTAGSFHQAKKGQKELANNTPTTTKTTTKITTEKKIPTQNQNLIDFEDDDGFGEFKSAPEKSVKKDIPKSNVEVKFVSNNETTQKSGIDLWDTSFEKKRSDVNQQKVRSLDPFSFEQPQNTLPNSTPKSNSVSTDSSKLYDMYKTGNPEQQNSNKPVNGTNFAGGQSNYAFLDGLGSQNQQNRFGQQQQQPFGFQNGMNGQSAKTQNYGGAQSQAGTYASQTSINNPTGGFSFGGSNNSFSSNSLGGVNNGGYGSSGFNSLGNNGFNSGVGKQQQKPFSFNQPTTTATFSFNTVNATQTLSQPTSVKTGFSFV